MEMIDVLTKLRKIAENNGSEDVARAIQSTEKMGTDSVVKEADPRGITAREIRQFESMLDEVEGHLHEAIGVLHRLERQGRVIPGPFSGQIGAYIRPHLQSWIDDRNQPGSLSSLRSILERAHGPDVDNDDEGMS